MDDPEPSVRLTELGDSDVGLQSRIWISNPSRADFVRTRGEYVTAVKRRFDEEGSTSPTLSARSRAASTSRAARASSSRQNSAGV